MPLKRHATLHRQQRPFTHFSLNWASRRLATGPVNGQTQLSPFVRSTLEQAVLMRLFLWSVVAGPILCVACATAEPQSIADLSQGGGAAAGTVTGSGGGVSFGGSSAGGPNGGAMAGATSGGVSGTSAGGSPTSAGASGAGGAKANGGGGGTAGAGGGTAGGG